MIIWGVDDYNTLALIRQIGQGDYYIHFLVVGKARYAAKSKYCSSYTESQNVEDSYDKLLKELATEGQKPVIVTNGDDIITFIDDHREQLLPYFILPGCTKQGDTRKYIDKYTMTCLAESIGIKVPSSKFVKWNSDLTGISYPCFIKPSHQKPGHYNEFKFKYCKDRQSLEKSLQFVRKDSVFIVQQFVKKEKDLLVYGCRTKDGDVIIAGGLVTDRFAVGQGSSYGVVSETVHESIDVNKIKQFLNEIDYVGLFSFEYGLMDGEAYFFEVNLRNDGTSHFFFQAGANIPLAYVNSSFDRDYGSVPTKVKNTCNYMDEIFDVSNVLIGNVSLKKWKQQREHTKAFKFYDSSDLLPYQIASKNKWIRIIRDIIIKKYRIYILFVLDKLGFRK